MKSKYLISGMVGTLLLLNGCATDSPLASIWPSSHYVKPTVARTNGEIMGELIAIDKGEISTDKLAKMKAKRLSVKRYAAYTQAQHSSNLQKVMNLSRKTDTPVVTDSTALMLQQDSKNELAQLKLLNNNDFDRAYIDAIIHDHQAALKLIDLDIAAATCPKLTKLLINTRADVVTHLHKAEVIQAEIH